MLLKCLLTLQTFAIFFILTPSIKCLNPQPSQSYPNIVTLQQPDIAFLYWNVSNNAVNFEIHVKNTSLWFLFGFQSVSLGYSDVIVAWVNPDGSGHFSERKLTTNSANQIVTTINPVQTWRLKDAYQKNDYYVVIFTRPVKLQCDPTNTNVLDINTGANNLVFTSGNLNTVNLDDNSVTISSLTASQVDILQGKTGFTCPPAPVSPVFNSTSTAYYENQVDLIPGIYRFYWNYTGGAIIGEIQCQTLGWVGFGLSPTGGMDGSDVVVGWISNGVTYFTDRHIVGRAVLPDTNQNWNLLYSGVNNGYTIFKFQRAAVTCDPQDFSIQVYK